jgi:hypothetical protein
MASEDCQTYSFVFAASEKDSFYFNPFKYYFKKIPPRLYIKVGAFQVKGMIFSEITPGVKLLCSGNLRR